MPLYTKVIAGLVTLLSIPVFGVAIIGANYSSPFLTHLVDIVQGANTRTVASLNAPNWGTGEPLAVPVISSVATSSNGSAASGLASSTPYTFAVAALDGDGTTTISATAVITTDASTTQHYPEDIVVKWPTVVGAQGYAIFFARSSNATTFSQYFLATSTNGIPNNQYTFSTSTGSAAGKDAQTDTTAFSNRIIPGSNSFFNGGSVGFATSTPASSTPVDINGYVRASLPATSTACYAATAGVIFYNTANGHEWGCNGTTWTKIF